MLRGVPYVVAVMGAVLLLGPASAGATVASGHLTGSNGEGTFNDTLDCGAPDNGDGDNWRYGWFDGAASSPGGLLLGTWDGTFEVHRATPTTAFIPNGDGRLSISLPGGARGGTGLFDLLGDGSCQNANLTLTQVDPFNPSSQRVSGTLPLEATFGTGAFRGLTGSGTATFTLDLKPGAQNVADVKMTGDFDVADPQVTVAGAQARWMNFSNYLGRRLTVYVTLVNAAGAGNAYNVRLTSASGGTNWFEGLPAGNATIPEGGAATFAFTMRAANANTTYTLNVGAALKDGMLADQPPVSGGVTFKSPLLP